MQQDDLAPPLDPGKAERLRRIAFTAVVDQQTAELVQELASADVASLVLRGPVIATWLYDDPTERSYGDVDLLVQPDRLEAAREVLKRLGFVNRLMKATPHDHTLHDEAWLRGPFFVDLHRTLSGVGAAAPVLWRALTREMSSLNVSGVELPAPSLVGRALIVALHAAHHGIEVERPLEDLRRALNRVPFETWQGATALASEVEATEAFRAGLGLVPAGFALAQKLKLSNQASVTVALRAASAPPMAVAIEWLAHGPLTRRQKAAFMTRKIFPPPAFLRESSALARQGVAGLTAAYFIRIGTLLRRVPAAIRALRHAQRETGRR